MAKPAIRCGLTGDGDIEAAIRDHAPPLRHVVIDRQTGEVKTATVRKGTNEFRWLVTEARKHVSK